jgi:chromosome segregation ATPase
VACSGTPDSLRTVRTVAGLPILPPAAKRLAMTKRTRRGDGDEQVELLRNIWNEMKALKASLESQLEATRREIGERIDQTNARLDQTNGRLDAVREELRDEMDGLRRRVVESEVRLATATTQLSSDVQQLSGLIREWREEHRADRAELRVRLARVEEHIGLTPK